MEIDVAIRSHGIPTDWSDEVLADIERLGSTVATEAIADRVDLRDLPLVTIDGADARDFDDAVYCENAGNGWEALRGDCRCRFVRHTRLRPR